MGEVIKLIGLVLVRINQLITQGVHVIEIITTLQATMNELKAASAAREARDLAQDAVTAAQIQSLQEQILALQAIVAAGGLDAEAAATVQGVIADLGALKVSLDAADPTPPAVV